MLGDNVMLCSGLQSSPSLRRLSAEVEPSQTSAAHGPVIKRMTAHGGEQLVSQTTNGSAQGEASVRAQFKQRAQITTLRQRNLRWSSHLSTSRWHDA